MRVSIFEDKRGWLQSDYSTFSWDDTYRLVTDDLDGALYLRELHRRGNIVIHVVDVDNHNAIAYYDEIGWVDRSNTGILED